MGLDYDQLFSWYGRHGFVDVLEYGGFTVHRYPAAMIVDAYAVVELVP